MFKMLFSPGRINTMELKNRVIMTAMHLNYTPGGKANERLIRFYEERARYEVAMAIVGGCAIDDFSGSPDMINLKDDEDMEGLSRLTEAVHRAGGRLCAQLYHGGAYVHSLFLKGKQAISPSGVFSRFTKETPRALTKEEIPWVVDNFAQGAKRAKAAGFDSVEILASAGYLISQFLSPLTNKRQDEYGGPLENRMRFGLEVARAVRAAVGREYPIICRIAGNDFVPGSHTNKEAKVFARALQEAGVDLLNVTGGWHETRVPQLLMCLPPATFKYLARGIKESVEIPVMACNRINDPRIAEALLLEGSADFVGMARALLADPQILAKAKEGRLEEIVHCIGCAQACFDHVFYMRPVSCLMNPRAGREFEIQETPAPRPKKVWVIGGGPAGLMAAATAARRGHKVTLFEKEPSLGGQLRLAGVPAMRRDFVTAAVDLERQVRLAGVQVRSGRGVNKAAVKRGRPDAVVVATGGRPIIPEIPGVDLGHVTTAWDVLAGRAMVGRDVVIIGGGAVGCETALHLCESSAVSGDSLRFLAFNKAETWEVLDELVTKSPRRVTILEMLKRIGQDIGLSTRWSILQDLERYGVKIITEATAKEILPDGVVMEREGRTEKVTCDSVVLAMGSRPVQELNEELAGIVPEIHVVGDAKGPRKALDAVWEGYDVGRTI